MKTVVVRTKEELQEALKSNADEIQIENATLIKQLRAINKLRIAGPLAIGAVIAAIPLIPVTGGASLPVTLFAFVGTSALTVSSGILGLCIAISGVVVIGVFTDWEEVEVAGVFKMKRKKSK